MLFVNFKDVVALINRGVTFYVARLVLNVQERAITVILKDKNTKKLHNLRLQKPKYTFMDSYI